MKEHITIAGQILIAPIRYMPGHVMTEEEADGFSKYIVSKAYQSLNKKKGLTQEELDRWVDSFQFGARRSRVDPHVAEVRLFAKKLTKGKKGKEFTKILDKMLKDPKVIEKARRRVADITELSESYLRDG